MDITTLTGLILIAGVISVLLKRYAPEYSMLINVAVGAAALAAIFSRLLPAVYRIRDLLYTAKVPKEYGTILLKCLGICFIAQFASDACRDAGETSLASKVELAGKAAIVLTSLPLFESVARIALGLIG